MVKAKAECAYKPVPAEDTLLDMAEVIKKRGNKAMWMCTLLMALCLMASLLLPSQPAPSHLNKRLSNSSSLNQTDNLYALYISNLCEFVLAYSLGEILLALCLLVQEMGHHATWWQTLAASTRPLSRMFFIPPLCLLVPMYQNNLLQSSTLKYSIFYAGCHPFLQLIMSSKILVHQDKSIITLGDAMAQGCYSTFYSRALRSLGERIEKFEQKHKVKITPRKLIILFPHNCRVAAKLEEWIGPQLSKFGCMDPYETKVAGCPRFFRLYVYKLSVGTKDYYCLLECPSNLLTLREFMLSPSPMGGSFSRSAAMDEANIFYSKLVQLCQEDLNVQHNFVALRYSDSEPKQLLEKLQKTVEVLDQQPTTPV